MKPTPFKQETDFAPIPFTVELCKLAKKLKEKGLIWKPHVGCFVWDEKEIIEVSSPFPNRIYFILNLGHFLKRFETVENIAEHLVWLPTWQQARLIAKKLQISDEETYAVFYKSDISKPGSDFFLLYNLILESL